jgi:hypothetical protein
MAQKRMFDKRVVESDKFTDLPNSSKALYFMAGMSADDKGFFQPRRLQKMCGFTDDDFKILIAKGFFIAFESGVMVVTDWNKNNWLDSRRITETEYVDELKLLKLINERYELLSPGESVAKPMLSQNSIEENSIDKNRIVKEEINKEEKRFKTPTFEQVAEYCKERNNKVDAQRFIDFYESKGWMIGKSKMKDWKACVRTWEKEDNKQDLDLSIFDKYEYRR